MAKQITSGYLEVICGPMFCGKTEELIRQVRRAVIGKKRVQVFKHVIDTRYGKDKKLFSHAGQTIEATIVSSAHIISRKIQKNTEIVAIDEAQWFGDRLVPVVEELLKKNIHVVIAGLALTYDRKPFAPMPTLMSMADTVTKLSAICSLCGADAVYHKKLVRSHVNPLNPDPSLVGTLGSYQPRCRNCFGKN